MTSTSQLAWCVPMMLVTALLVGAPTHVRAQASARQAVMGLEAAWGAAVMRHDGKAVARLLAEDVTYVGPDGILEGKAQIVQGVNADTTRFVRGANLDMRPRVHGNTVVITGVWTVTKRTPAGDVNQRNLWTDTWVKSPDGAWRCIAGQVMTLAK